MNIDQSPDTVSGAALQRREIALRLISHRFSVPTAAVRSCPAAGLERQRRSEAISLKVEDLHRLNARTWLYVHGWTKTETGQDLDDVEFHLMDFEKMASGSRSIVT